jgi:hypothetical protein
MECIIKKLEVIINYTFCIFIGCVLACTLLIFVVDYNIPIVRGFEQHSLFVLNCLLLIMGFVIIKFAPSFVNKITKITLGEKRSYSYVFVLLTIYFIVSAIWIIKSNLTIMWDYRDLYNLATIYFEKGYFAAMNEPGITTPGLVVLGVNYLDQFPNNLGMLFALISIGTLFGHSVLRYEIFNLLVMCFSFFIIYKLVLKFTSNRMSALLSMIISMMFLPFFFYTPIFYNDVLSMPFILGGMYLLFDDKDKITSSKIKLFLSFVLLSIGYILRAPVIICVIAVIIIFILRKRFLSIISFIITMFLIVTSFNFLIDQSGIYEERRAVGVPIFHWIAMAQNDVTLGQNYVEDYNDTFSKLASGVSKEQITAEKKELFLQRIKEKGVIGNLLFNIKKISYLWGDPLYEGWFTYNYEQNDKIIFKKLFNESILAVGVYSYAKIYQNILYISLLIFAVKSLKTTTITTTFDILIMLTFTGFFLFYLIWEVHPRYLLCILPLFLSHILIKITEYGATTESLIEKI